MLKKAIGCTTFIALLAQCVYNLKAASSSLTQCVQVNFYLRFNFLNKQGNLFVDAIWYISSSLARWKYWNLIPTIKGFDSYNKVESRLRAKVLLKFVILKEIRQSNIQWHLTFQIFISNDILIGWWDELVFSSEPKVADFFIGRNAFQTYF